ncbi:hypothetical protein NPIL_312991 [Nephila pilipes]|uniref:Uncharacterized protein n=1 Tax=Nephila pilipes TaxID=299642 RepID=A0A8X6USW0_NEPPI|nr:hypothetical protein NPIL_312991 [Nephila pilipes]
MMFIDQIQLRVLSKKPGQKAAPSDNLTQWGTRCDTVHSDRRIAEMAGFNEAGIINRLEFYSGKAVAATLNEPDSHEHFFPLNSPQTLFVCRSKDRFSFHISYRKVRRTRSTVWLQSDPNSK